MKKIIVLFTISFLCGCTSKNQLLVNAEGDLANCSGTGYGLPEIIFTALSVDDCIEKFKNAGYIKIEEAGLIGVVLRTDESLIIAEVKKDSPASRSGIKMGDKVCKINNAIPITRSAANKALFGKPGTWVNLELKRGTEYFSKTIMRAEYALVYKSK